MAPYLSGDAALAPRNYYCSSGYHYSNGYCYSRWSWWGRWVLTGVIIFFFILFALLLVCRRSRRRRNPAPTRYGPQNGWFARPGQGQAQPQYAGGVPQYNTAGPQYSAPPPQYSPAGGSNQGYYAGTQSSDIPLQQPASAYYPTRGVNGGDEDYAAPEGPPPSKK